MSTKYPGGFITKSPVAPTTTAASGVWTLDQQQQYQKAGTWPAPPIFIEDLFSTYLYTGNGSTQTITNGIDLSGEGGMVWLKCRNSAENNEVYDTVRGANQRLITNTTGAQVDRASSMAFSSTGLSWVGDNISNTNGNTYASWTFREQPKFFDIVTATNTGGTNARISHNLGSVPGFVIVKAINYSGESWRCYHRSIGINGTIQLNLTDGTFVYSNYWGTSDPTATDFGINWTLFSGTDYIFYFFAHDAGGFPASGSGSTNGITCGSYTGSSNTPQQITLGYEPQWVLLKKSSTTDSWRVFDNMRGMALSTGGNAILEPNTSSAESASSNWILPNATGFVAGSSATDSATYIYIAIRRGPMKTPTTGTSVFETVTSSASAGTVLTTGFPVDLQIQAFRSTTGAHRFMDRLRGVSTNSTAGSISLASTSTAAETTSGSYSLAWNNTGFQMTTAFESTSGVFWNFQRAPSFFDEVCYTGDGNSSQTLSHNLGATPQLVLIKVRNSVYDWLCYSETTGTSNTLFLNLTNASTAYTIVTVPTSTTFRVSGVANNVTETYVAYLFATCPGVSKVGSYTGTGTSIQVDCGFTSGARFFMIKRTDAAGNWFVWDTARGIVSGNDPYLKINSTDPEVTNEDLVDPYSAGFEVNTSVAQLNASGGTYIFLAIA